MKNIWDIMKEFGIEVPEDKKKEFEKSVLENYKTVADYEKQKESLEKANDTIKANDSAMKDLQGKLDGMKDVDVTALNSRIKELEEEKKNIETEFATKLADRDFNDMLKESIASLNGRNPKAIASLLDIDTLKASKNQKEDIAEALKALTEKEDSKMLFGEPEPDVSGKGDPIGTVKKTGSADEMSEMRAAMGLPPSESKGEMR